MHPNRPDPMSGISIQPHAFEPLGRFTWRRRWCRRCYHLKHEHPVSYWAAARPYSIKRWWH